MVEFGNFTQSFSGDSNTDSTEANQFAKVSSCHRTSTKPFESAIAYGG